MIYIICGKKGSGKTKRILDMANEMALKSNGKVIFVDYDNRCMFDLRHQVRYLIAPEFGIDNPDRFYGYLSGLVAGDFDTETIFIDGFLKIVKEDISKLEDFFLRLENLAEKNRINFVVSVSCEKELIPETIGKHIA
ncbi:MAG: hypothetical protein Q8O09_02195 [Bacillota bacterium]|nr:hypothetical protein [Bacillota bacterium]